MKTIVGLYDEMAEARNVVQDLVDSGFDRDNINLVAGDPEGRYGAMLDDRDVDTDGPTDNTPGEAAVDGAIAGGAIGGLAGVLLGLGAFAIPGLGPVVAVGPIVSGLIGAGVGAASGSLLAALVEWGLSEEEAGYYSEGVRRGGILVAIKADDNQVNHIINIMNRHNPVDIEHRVSEWQEEGWTGYDANASAYTATDVNRSRGYTAPNTGEKTIPVIEEEMHVGKREVERAGVHVESHIEETPVEKQVHLETRSYGDDFDTYRSDFRRHYNINYTDSDYDYTSYEPAYRYGYILASDQRFQDRDWNEIEPEVRRRWEETNEGTWDDFVDAIEHGWNRVKNAF